MQREQSKGGEGPRSGPPHLHKGRAFLKAALSEITQEPDLSKEVQAFLQMWDQQEVVNDLLPYFQLKPAYNKDLMKLIYSADGEPQQATVLLAGR